MSPFVTLDYLANRTDNHFVNIKIIRLGHRARKRLWRSHLCRIQVGYESPSQFSREYKRLFGAPRFRDIADLKSSREVQQPPQTG